MAKKPKNKMPVAERAKQFMPFSALRGLERALKAKEREMGFIPKAELYEEEIAEINEKLNSLKKGDPINIVYFSQGTYQAAQGTIAEIDRIERALKLEDDLIIAIDDIKELF